MAELISAVAPIFLIFGGCCSNVFALEAIIKTDPTSGHLLTFAQFLLVAFEGLLQHFDSKSPILLKRNQVPLKRWLGQIALFFSVSLLNNAAFGYHISVPVHIILRSGGSVTTMIVGWFFGKRFTRNQVYSVILLTVGVIISALGDAQGKESTSEQSLERFLTGLGILFVAQVLSAFMGLYVEETYNTYGKHWREGLFYTHFLALPLFIPLASNINSHITSYMSSSRITLPIPSSITALIPWGISHPPSRMFYLFLNVFTQYVCVRGVNLLGSSVTALTVTIVLNIRKLASLLLSIWLFGNRLNQMVLVGAALVFLGGGLYGWEGARINQKKKEEAAKGDSKKNK